MWHLICSGYLSCPLFFSKREISFEVSTFGGSFFSGGSLLSGFANTCDILSLLSEVRYLRGVVTFVTVYGNYGSYTTDLNISHSVSMYLSHK